MQGEPGRWLQFEIALRIGAGLSGVPQPVEISYPPYRLLRQPAPEGDSLLTRSGGIAEAKP
jgi:hypothetical protein